MVHNKFYMYAVTINATDVERNVDKIFMMPRNVVNVQVVLRLYIESGEAMQYTWYRNFSHIEENSKPSCTGEV